MITHRISGSSNIITDATNDQLTAELRSSGNEQSKTDDDMPKQARSGAEGKDSSREKTAGGIEGEGELYASAKVSGREKQPLMAQDQMGSSKKSGCCVLL